jgi:hypothetical protein
VSRRVKLVMVASLGVENVMSRSYEAVTRTSFPPPTFAMSPS